MLSQDRKEAAIRAGALTPRRSVSVQWDVDEAVADETFFLQYREANQMRPEFVSGCIRLLSGIWQLAPLNDWGTNHESTLGQSFVIRLADWYHHNDLFEVPYFRNPSELVGITPSSEVAVSGDYFLTKRIEAGLTWAGELSNGDVPLQIIADNHYPLEFMARTFALHRSMSGYMLKASFSGGPLQTKDVVLGFKFGGLITADSYGVFFLALKGDGTAILYEKILNLWEEQGRWRFMSPAEMPGGAFGMWILPYFPDGIEFDTYTGGGGGEDYFKLLGDRSLDISSGTNATQGAEQNHIFRTGRGKNTRAPGGDLQAITGNGNPELYIRQDLRPYVQIARLAYLGPGVITDKAIAVPEYSASSEHVLRATVKGWNIRATPGEDPVTRMSASLIDADTGDPLTPQDETQTWRGETITWHGFVPPGGKHAVKAEILLESDPDENDETWWTPYMASYMVARNANIGTIAPGVKTGGTLIRVATSGPGYDPEAETGYLAFQDPKNQLAFLRSRGKASVRVSTTFDTAGTESTQTCVIYDGYTGRVTHSLRGKVGMSYPSQEWRDLEAECEGKWQRLTEKFFHVRIPFHDSADSPTPATDSEGQLPWLVTDIIRFLLSISGFAESQLDIPTNSIRLFLRPGQKQEGLYTLMPGTSVAEYLTMLCRDFINGFLYWEPNMGTSGGWRLRQPPTEATTPLWTFTLRRPTGGVKLAHQSVSYGSLISPILGPDHGFPFETHVVPPEGNCITVSGGWDQKTNERFQMSITNEESFNAPSHPATADAANLDFVSVGIVPIEYVDVTLDSQEAVNWIARRIYNLACRGRKFVRFTAEMVIRLRSTADAALFTTHPRTLLRPGDLINIQDQAGVNVLHILHQCSPDFTHHGTMRAEYLAELFRPDATYYYTGDQGLPKEITKRQAKRALGTHPTAPRLHLPQSRHSSLDGDILALPVKPADPIKTGTTWTFMLNFSALDGADVLA